MTDEQINIAIAEACGYRRFVHTNYGWMACTPDADLGPMSDDYLLRVKVPDYVNDLNAMHEAEKVLEIDQQYVYGEELRAISGNVGPRGGHFIPNGWGVFTLATATPSERAEAFLRTIGEWEEVQP